MKTIYHVFIIKFIPLVEIEFTSYNKNKEHVIVIYQGNLLIELGPWCYHVRNNFIKNIWKERPLQCRKENAHSVKSVHIWSYSDPYFSAFGLNTVWYSVCLRIQSECGKVRTDIILNTDTFCTVAGIQEIAFLRIPRGNFV